MLQNFGNDLEPEVSAKAAAVLERVTENTAASAGEVSDEQAKALLSSASLLTTNLDGSVNSTEAQSQMAQTSKKVISAVEKIGEAATKGLDVGGSPRILEVKDLRVEVAKKSAAQLDTGFSMSGFTMPRLGGVVLQREGDCGNTDCDFQKQ